MFAMIPILCFVLIILSLRKKSNGDAWRSSFLSASIIWGLSLTIITEILSLLRSLTFAWLLGLWGVTSIAWAFMYLCPIERNLRLRPMPKIPSALAALLLGVSLIAAITGLIALIAPPNNSDSMTYHMSRIVHWIQNRGVAFYPTHILRQLHQNPWAEFAIMNFQILSSGDRLANLVQWFSMVGSILGVTLIAMQLGAGMRGQILAAAVAATLPMGILQASSTQNDYVVCYWLVCFVYYTVTLTVTGSMGWSPVLGAGLSLGLAILTKATAYLFAFPFLLWLVLSRLKTARWESWKPPFVIVFLALSINVGHYGRNLDLYGSVLGPRQERELFAYANEVFTVSSVISNIVRNIGLHIGTPSERINAVTERGISVLHTLLGIDANDPRTAWAGLEFHIPTMSNHEDKAGNPVHLALIIVSVCLALKWREPREARSLLYYSSAVTMAFLLFTLLLKWQPWHSRLHLPLFVLWSPFVAIVLCRIPNHRVATSIVTVLMLSALPWVFYNKSRPLLGEGNIINMRRIDQYFNNLLALRDPYMGAANFLKSRKCPQIGLSVGWNDPEYLLWAALRETANYRARLEHVNVHNLSIVKSRTFPITDFIPCAIVSTDPNPSKEMATDVGVYAQKWSLTPVSVFIKQ